MFQALCTCIPGTTPTGNLASLVNQILIFFNQGPALAVVVLKCQARRGVRIEGVQESSEDWTLRVEVGAGLLLQQFPHPQGKPAGQCGHSDSLQEGRSHA